LQAQLAQVLFGQTIVQPSFGRIPKYDALYTQPCNTPTHSSGVNVSDHEENTRCQVALSWRSDVILHARKDDLEDERMVEDLLIPSLPASPAIQHPLPKRSLDSALLTSDELDHQPSSFASTDPFYLAQCQAMNQPAPSSSQSLFAQIGLPAPQSPFTRQTSSQEHSPFVPASNSRPFILNPTPAFNR